MEKGGVLTGRRLPVFRIGFVLETIPAFILLAVSLMLVWCYSPGLSGPFLLDDFHTLRGLAEIQGRVTWENLVSYLETGVTGPTGRPLSLLSFLLDSTSWPASPYPFKRTNVFLHLVNGLLIFWISLLLLQRVQLSSRRARVMAALAASIWLFNPYHVSTVLYVVQRMAILSSMFMLVGLVMYLKGRFILRDRPKVGLGLIMAAYLVAAGLGSLAKENAALFVLIIPVLEWTLFQRDIPAPSGLRHLLRLTIAVPAFLFLAAMGTKVPDFLVDYAQYRDFSLLERLLSQPRALGYYLWRYIVPGYEYIGIYGDGFRKSTGLFEPVSTFFWLVAHAVLIVTAVRKRRELPTLSFGILFFYVAHLLESSIIPLEMFFEHRSYFPSAFVWLAILVILPFRGAVVAGAVLILASLFLLRAQAEIWVDHPTYTRTHMETHGSSERAVMALARWYATYGRLDDALDELREFSRNHPMGQEGASMLVLTACVANDLHESDLVLLKESPSVYRVKTGMFLDRMGRLIDMLRNGTCRGLSADHIHDVLDRYEAAHDRTPREMQAYLAIRAKLELALDNDDAFIELGLASLEQYPSMYYAKDFCRFLSRYGRDASCSCFARADSLIGDQSEIVTSSLVRRLTGYREAEVEKYRTLAKSVCPENYVK